MPFFLLSPPLCAIRKKKHIILLRIFFAPQSPQGIFLPLLWHRAPFSPDTLGADLLVGEFHFGLS